MTDHALPPRMRTRAERERDDAVVAHARRSSVIRLTVRVLVVLFFGMAVVAEARTGLSSSHLCGVAAAAWICMGSVVKALGHAFAYGDVSSLREGGP